jgi:hypothetical protein
MRVDRLRVIALLGLVLSACGPRTVTAPHLRIGIKVDKGPYRSACVKLDLRAADGDAPLGLTDGAPFDRTRLNLTAIVVRGRLPETIRVQAIGFSDAACTVPTSPAEVSEVGLFTFPEFNVRDETLTLQPAAVSIDADGDLVPSTMDCNDMDPTVAPGKPEVCTDGKDNDCDTSTDCADSECNGKQCAGLASVCASNRCTETDCANRTDDDADQAVDCADTDCDGQACRNGGSCRDAGCSGARSEQGLCDDALDNDNDGKPNCLDEDCQDETCSDGRGCTTGERCSNFGCDGGMPVTCGAGSNVCASSMGTCQEPDGGCLYAPLPPDAGCSDGLACTTADTCDGDGGCTGTPRECSTPPPGDCWESSGFCDEARDGGCVYSISVGRLSCTDMDPCSVNDACLEDGGCLGQLLDCSNAIPPNECQTSANQCVAGACQFMNRDGGCDGGTCASGQCVPDVVDAGMVDAGQVDAGVPDAGQPIDAGMMMDAGVADAGGVVDAGAFLLPSNVPLSTITNAPPFAHFDVGCNSTISLNPVGIQANSLLCSPPALPPSVVVSQVGGPSLVVFVVDRLTIQPNVTLRFSGPADRVPVIAVRGDATINGILDVSAVQVIGTITAGPGGGGSFCPASAPGVQNGNASGGGQGGGFGRAGGNGGRGADSGGAGATGVVVNGTPTLVPLRGGCNGSRGGGANADRFGRAAGAVQVWARGQLVINGAVLAAGGFGLWSGIGSSQGSGGGGGGSGGGILLEGTRVSIGSSAIVAANGGGGAEGSSLGGGNNGQAGTSGLNPANGGTGANDCGGFGGRGSARTNVTAGNGEEGGVQGACNFSDLGGGGGGGGGMGRVRINSLLPCTVVSTAQISPQASSAQVSCAP